MAIPHTPNRKLPGERSYEVGPKEHSVIGKDLFPLSPKHKPRNHGGHGAPKVNTNSYTVSLETMEWLINTPIKVEINPLYGPSTIPVMGLIMKIQPIPYASREAR